MRETTNPYSSGCSPDLTTGVGNNITGAPLFADVAAANWRLAEASPCIDAGQNDAWMQNAVDLDGNPRIRRRFVDMGAYELPPLAGMLIILR